MVLQEKQECTCARLVSVSAAWLSASLNASAPASFAALWWQLANLAKAGSACAAAAARPQPAKNVNGCNAMLHTACQMPGFWNIGLSHVHHDYKVEPCSVRFEFVFCGMPSADLVESRVYSQDVQGPYTDACWRCMVLRC